MCVVFVYVRVGWGCYWDPTARRKWPMQCLIFGLAMRNAFMTIDLGIVLF